MDSLCQLILLVCLCCNCLTLCSSAVNQTSVEVQDNAAYITLVQSHAKYCGHAFLCSHFKNAEKSELCCMPCSCDTNCVRKNNCCVDYYLMDILNMTTFSDVTEFISKLNNISDVEDVIFPDALTQSDIRTDDRVSSLSPEVFECSPTSLFPTLESTTVRMVTKCPSSYTNTTVINKCESVLNYDNGVNVDLLIEITPVTSKENGYIYKNRFCLLCHSPDGLGFSWDIIYELNARASNLQKFSRSFEELFKTFSLSQSAGYNVLFKPPNEQIVASQIQHCRILDIEHCERQAGAGINKACSIFRAPVANVIGGKRLVRNGVISRNAFVTLANTACIDCIYSDVTTISACTLPRKLQFVLKDLIHYNRKLVNESGYILDVQHSSYCGTGYIYDERKKLCRHVECPMYWSIESGQCVPMITKILNGVYSMNLLLRVRLESSSDEKKQAFETTVVVLFQSIIKVHFGTAIPLYGLNIGEVRTTNQNQTVTEYFVNLQIKSDDVEFVHVLKLLSSLLRDVIGYTKKKGYETSVTLTNMVSTSKEEDGQVYTMVRSDRQLTMKRTNNVSFTQTILTLGRTYLCYRVMLNRDEYYDRIGRYYFTAKLNKEIVLSTDLQFYRQDKVVACIDNAVGVPEHLLYLNLDADEEPTTSKDKTFNVNEKQVDSSHTRGLWALAAIVVIVILPIVSAKLRKKLQRQRAE